MGQAERSKDALAEEAALHKLWKYRFQADLPVADHVGMIREILVKYGVDDEEIDDAIREERQARGLSANSPPPS
jgi:hypothetical protein